MIAPLHGADEGASKRAIPYRRVDLEKLAAERPDGGAPGASQVKTGVDVSRRMRLWLVLPLSIALCVLQACVTILAANFRSIYLTSTMIPVLTFGALFVLVVAANPLLRLANLGRLVRAPADALWIALWAATTATVCAVFVSWVFWLVLALVVGGGIAYALLVRRPDRCDAIWGGAGLGLLVLSLVAGLVAGSLVPLLVFAALLYVATLLFVRRIGSPADTVWIVLWAATTATVCAVFVSWVFWLVLALAVAGGVAYAILGGKPSWHDLVWGGAGLGGLALALVIGLAAGSSIPALLFAALLLVATMLFVRAFTRAELVSVFCAMLVTAGVSTYGLSAQLVPLIGAPWNPEWNTPQRGWSEHVLPHLNRKLYLTNPETVRTFREGLGAPEPAASFSERMDHYGRVFGLIPWGDWGGRIAYWLVFVFACYGAFYFLAYIVLGYWSEREKLIFPLAKLPESLVPEQGLPARWVPRIFSSPGFWAGFATSFLVLSWNSMVDARWIAGLGRIRLGLSVWRVNDIIRGSFAEGLSNGLMFLVIFTAIGISFLLPLEISFSAWFYVLLGKLFLLAAVWMGYGRNTSDFPTNWLWMNNPVSAQGAGAMLLFSGISLYRSTREYARLAAGRTRAERVKLLLPLIGLAVCLLVMTAWLSWNRLGVFWSLIVVVFLTLITVGLMRIVAQGGIYWFQSHASFFHAYKMLGLGKILAPVLVGPLLLIYSVLFLDIKTFMAPELLHAAKLRGDSGASRARFHVNVVVCILVTVVFALGFAVFAAHVVGAQQMCGWFYSMAPQQFVDTAQRAATTPPEFQAGTVAWYGVGAGWLALSMFLRRTLFWFPHPIGYIMLVNPLMSQLWFSFFLGWVCKKVVVKYGGKATFDRVRVIFIGLIVGELIAAFLWNLFALGFGFSVSGLDLNRYGA